MMDYALLTPSLNKRQIKCLYVAKCFLRHIKCSKNSKIEKKVVILLKFMFI